jgi:hypothetical protein
MFRRREIQAFKLGKVWRTRREIVDAYVARRLSESGVRRPA